MTMMATCLRTLAWSFLLPWLFSSKEGGTWGSLYVYMYMYIYIYIYIPFKGLYRVPHSPYSLLSNSKVLLRDHDPLGHVAGGVRGPHHAGHGRGVCGMRLLRGLNQILGDTWEYPFEVYGHYKP